MTAEDVIDWLRELPPAGVHVFLAISSFIENVFPPWTGDTFIVFGGFLAAQDVISLPIAFLSILIGNLCGAYLMYFAGARILRLARRFHKNARWLPRWLKSILEGLTSEASMQRAERLFARWGVPFVVLSRFSAGIRFFVSIIAGVSHMNPIVFGVAFAVGVFIWNSLLLAGGYAVGDNWRSILEYLAIYNRIVIGSIIVAIGCYGFYRWRVSVRNRNDTKESNLPGSD